MRDRTTDEPTTEEKLVAEEGEVLPKPGAMSLIDPGATFGTPASGHLPIV